MQVSTLDIWIQMTLLHLTFENITYFYFKGRVPKRRRGEEERERESWVRLKPDVLSIFCISYMYPGAQGFESFSESAFPGMRRELGLKWNHQNLNQHPHGAEGRSFACHTTVLAPYIFLITCVTESKWIVEIAIFHF